jgi:hypothetical protein
LHLLPPPPPLTPTLHPPPHFLCTLSELCVCVGGGDACAKHPAMPLLTVASRWLPVGGALQATLVFYFVYAFVESDVNELGKMTHSDIWRMISSFAVDVSKATVASSSAVFMRTFVPAVVTFLQQYLSALDSDGECTQASAAGARYHPINCFFGHDCPVGGHNFQTLV